MIVRMSAAGSGAPARSAPSAPSSWGSRPACVPQRQAAVLAPPGHEHRAPGCTCCTDRCACCTAAQRACACACCARARPCCTTVVQVIRCACACSDELCLVVQALCTSPLRMRMLRTSSALLHKRCAHPACLPRHAWKPHMGCAGATHACVRVTCITEACTTSPAARYRTAARAQPELLRPRACMTMDRSCVSAWRPPQQRH